MHGQQNIKNRKIVHRFKKFIFTYTFTYIYIYVYNLTYVSIHDVIEV